MPIIKVWGVPTNTPQDTLEYLCNEIRHVVASAKALKVASNSVTVFFPSDLMTHGLGEEVIVEVVGLFATPERTYQVQQDLAHSIVQVITKYFPLALVECFVYPFDLEKCGFSNLRPK